MLRGTEEGRDPVPADQQWDLSAPSARALSGALRRFSALDRDRGWRLGDPTVKRVCSLKKRKKKKMKLCHAEQNHKTNLKLLRKAFLQFCITLEVLHFRKIFYSLSRNGTRQYNFL